MDIADLFGEIKAYQKEMGYDFNKLSPEQRVVILRNYIVAMQVEQVEFLNEFPWKPWRPVSGQHVGSQEKIADEWVDCLFFLIDQALCVGLTAEEVVKAYKNKMKVNIKRITEGYNQKTKGD